MFDDCRLSKFHDTLRCRTKTSKVVSYSHLLILKIFTKTLTVSGIALSTRRGFWQSSVQLGLLAAHVDSASAEG